MYASFGVYCRTGHEVWFAPHVSLLVWPPRRLNAPSLVSYQTFFQFSLRLPSDKRSNTVPRSLSGRAVQPLISGPFPRPNMGQGGGGVPLDNSRDGGDGARFTHNRKRDRGEGGEPLGTCSMDRGKGDASFAVCNRDGGEEGVSPLCRSWDRGLGDRTEPRTCDVTSTTVAPSSSTKKARTTRGQ